MAKLGRPRRTIIDGLLRCPGCEKWIHISGYYCNSKVPDYYVVDGVSYGKPQSRCRECVKKYTPVYQQNAINEAAERAFQEAFEELKEQGLRLVRRGDGSLYATKWIDDDPRFFEKG